MQITFLSFFAPGIGMKINQISSVDAEAYLKKLEYFNPQKEAYLTFYNFLIDFVANVI